MLNNGLTDPRSMWAFTAKTMLNGFLGFRPGAFFQAPNPSAGLWVPFEGPGAGSWAEQDAAILEQLESINPRASLAGLARARRLRLLPLAPELTDGLSRLGPEEALQLLDAGSHNNLLSHADRGQLQGMLEAAHSTSGR